MATTAIRKTTTRHADTMEVTVVLRVWTARIVMNRRENATAPTQESPNVGRALDLTTILDLVVTSAEISAEILAEISAEILETLGTLGTFSEIGVAVPGVAVEEVEDGAAEGGVKNKLRSKNLATIWLCNYSFQ